MKYDKTIDEYLRIGEKDDSNIDAYQFEKRNNMLIHVASGKVAEVDTIWIDNCYHRVKFGSMEDSGDNLDN